tara:strand:+ start:2261 stop:2926 length:666 start_codon:yes stop_codon:yes gene_type:complete
MIEVFNAIEQDRPSVLAELSDYQLPVQTDMLKAILFNQAKECLIHFIERFNTDVKLSALIESGWLEAYDILIDYDALTSNELGFEFVNANDRTDCSYDSFAYLLHAIKHNQQNFVEFYLNDLKTVQDILCIDADFTEIMSPSSAIIAVLSTKGKFKTSLDVAIDAENINALQAVSAKLNALINAEGDGAKQIKALRLIENHMIDGVSENGDLVEKLAYAIS